MDKNKIAVIGGTALQRINGLQKKSAKKVNTPYGEPSSELTHGVLNDKEFVFISRHGDQHQIPPHRINYRANIWALREAGVKGIIALSSVGGIAPAMSPGMLVVPDQIIDYSWGREQTFFDTKFSLAKHIEFTYPYDEALRQRLLKSAAFCKQLVVSSGTMAVTQGPRLETAAEIERLKQDGCDLIGMTAMPEAALARELELPYACLAVVVNWAAGISDKEISIDDIELVLEQTQRKVNRILIEFD